MKQALKKFGLPRIIIVTFFILLLVAAAAYGMDMPSLISDVIRRFGMFGVLTLAMVPSVQAGVGLNFGISMGVVGGLMGGVLAIELRITETLVQNWSGSSNAFLINNGPLLAMWVSILFAIAFGVFVSLFTGYLYGFIMNRVKGSEMTVTTYIGFSMIAFMNIIWTILPMTNGVLIMPNAGEGVRQMISLDDSFREVMSNTLSFKIGNFFFPTGLILFLALSCFLVYLFMRSKTGLAMSAAGANPQFAKASGINVNRMRMTGTVLSTVIASAGILIYSQGLGFMQLYNGPLMIGFNAVAAVLIGGATPKHARISHVLIGTFLFQGILTLGLPVANFMVPGANMSEVIRLIVSNGIILYALTQSGGKRDD